MSVARLHKAITHYNFLPPGESLYSLVALPLPGRLRVKIMSSRKPEVHNVLHCYQTRTEPQTQLTHTENFVKFGHICKWTDRQTRSLQYAAPLMG